ncbi:MAG: tRNA pseudouridine(38-40) synthase TruA [Bacteroidales bacterium]|nr:tRNA pseudouridine(38-40) synthase TruA [Bacteroidales bacterium]
MQRYFIELAYNGKNYNGWQIQENAPSVQQAINEAISVVLQKKINIVGCGRTDTGVHARQFFAHFDLEEVNKKLPVKSLINRLNGILPWDISIYNLFQVQPDLHARFSAIKRTYEYKLTRRKDPFDFEYAYYYPLQLNVGLMNEAANLLLTYSDFTSFSKVNTQVKTNICKIEKAYWQEEGQILVFQITADRFLRNMVRAIAGTLIDVGKGKISIQDFKTIIDSKNRSNAGFSVPAKGLCLTDVFYPDLTN